MNYIRLSNKMHLILQIMLEREVLQKAMNYSFVNVRTAMGEVKQTRSRSQSISGLVSLNVFVSPVE